MSICDCEYREKILFVRSLPLSVLCWLGAFQNALWNQNRLVLSKCVACCNFNCVFVLLDYFLFSFIQMFVLYILLLCFSFFFVFFFCIFINIFSFCYGANTHYQEFRVRVSLFIFFFILFHFVVFLIISQSIT